MIQESPMMRRREESGGKRHDGSFVVSDCSGLLAAATSQPCTRIAIHPEPLNRGRSAPKLCVEFLLQFRRLHLHRREMPRCTLQTVTFGDHTPPSYQCYTQNSPRERCMSPTAPKQESSGMEAGPAWQSLYLGGLFDPFKGF